MSLTDDPPPSELTIASANVHREEDQWNTRQGGIVTHLTEPYVSYCVYVVGVSHDRRSLRNYPFRFLLLIKS